MLKGLFVALNMNLSTQTYVICFMFSCLVQLIGSHQCLAKPSEHYEEPLRELETSKVFKKTIKTVKKKHYYHEFYTEKWFNAGSFYGQIFLRDNGEKFLFDWLDLPEEIYSPAKTAVVREPEFFKTERIYLDDKAKSIAITILIPHPRSIEAINQGLVSEFSKYIPKEGSFGKRAEVQLKEGSATLYQLENGECSAVIHAAKESLIEARVIHCSLQSNLEKFIKDLNLILFNQRMQS